MYIGRDMTELSMIPKSEWKDSELAFSTIPCSKSHRI